MGIIEHHDLYRSERAQLSIEDVVSRMRGEIGIQLVSASVFQVSFASSDARKAQPVANELMNQLAGLKDDASGSVVQLLDPPDEPQVSVSPRRVTVAGAGGFSGGALFGMLIGLLRRRVSQPAS
jgi:uncharacterized protein involved in exopolysaccharide biosynthesis